MGSNLAAPEQQLRNAIEALAQLPGTTVAGVSAFYQSDSLLPGQPRYTNAVAALDSCLAPLELLDALQAIENDQGRERLERWGPRTLDLDILLFGDRLIDETTPASAALSDAPARLRAVPAGRTGPSHPAIARWPAPQRPARSLPVCRPGTHACAQHPALIRHC